MKVKAWVYAEYSHYSRGFTYSVWPHDSYGAAVKVWEGEVDIPDIDESQLVNGTVKLMKDAQQKIRAEAEAKVQNIEGQIQELLCLEYKSEVAK